jgi:hypothetical protein
MLRFWHSKAREIGPKWLRKLLGMDLEMGLPTLLGGRVEGLKNSEEDFRKETMDIGMVSISESSAITARRMGISLMSVSNSCGKSKSLKTKVMKTAVSPPLPVPASSVESIR